MTGLVIQRSVSARDSLSAERKRGKHERESSFVLSETFFPYVPVDDMRVAWLLPFLRPIRRVGSNQEQGSGS